MTKYFFIALVSLFALAFWVEDFMKSPPAQQSGAAPVVHSPGSQVDLRKFESPALVGDNQYIRPGTQVQLDSCDQPPFVEPFEFLMQQGIDPSERFLDIEGLAQVAHYYQVGPSYFEVRFERLPSANSQVYRLHFRESPSGRFEVDGQRHFEPPALYQGALSADTFQRSWSRPEGMEQVRQILNRADELGGRIGSRLAELRRGGLKVEIENGAILRLDTPAITCELRRAKMILSCRCL